MIGLISLMLNLLSLGLWIGLAFLKEPDFMAGLFIGFNVASVLYLFPEVKNYARD